MKVNIDINQSVDVDISIADIVDAIKNQPEPNRTYLARNAISNAYSVIKGIPDEIISTMDDMQKELVAKCFREQADRYG